MASLSKGGLLARFVLAALLAVVGLVLEANTASAVHLTGSPATYTLDADFDEGTLINVNHDAPNSDQLQLDDTATPFEFIWVAVSSAGTIIKINTSTGAILGEYRTHPSLTGFGANPSRTTVDNDGSVWVGNRSGNPGSVTHVGLEENNQCEDRNNNGVIDTSTGLGDVRAWSPNASGGAPDSPQDRNVLNAADECIVHHVPLPNNPSGGTRHISVDANNDVWVSSTGNRTFALIQGGKYDVPGSGDITRTEPSVGYGGYGGLIDGNGVIWSARPLLRWDTVNPLTGPNGDPAGTSIGPPILGRNWAGQGSPDSYGLCLNPNNGEVWETQLSGNLIHRYASDGTFIAQYGHGSWNAQGCVVDSNGHVWIAHSVLGGNTTVGHLDAAGAFLGNVGVGSGPTGVAVDAAGKVWATNYYGRTVSRIDPAIGAAGAVDFTTPDIGGNPYNYSDMTGSTLSAPPSSGTWTVSHDSGVALAEWGTIQWNDEPEGSVPGDSTLTVEARSSDDGSTWSGWESVSYGVDLTVPDGQYLQVRVSFTRSTTTDADGDGVGDSPVLSDLTIAANLNDPPDCSGAAGSVAEIWPPNHKFVDVSVIGVTDPDGDPITITIDSIFQDEPVDTFGDGKHTPDGMGVGTDTAQVRAERSGTRKVPGDGRFYHIGFTASDGNGETCTLDGGIDVVVPHDQGKKGSAPVDQGALYDSTVS